MVKETTAYVSSGVCYWEDPRACPLSELLNIRHLRSVVVKCEVPPVLQLFQATNDK